MADALLRARANGFVPRTIIDGGAAHGEFSILAQAVFPNALIVVVEPLQEFHSRLEALGTQFGWRVVPQALGSEIDRATFHVHEDLVGSSLLREVESGVDGKTRQVNRTTLDHLEQDLGLQGPFLIKLDVQGAEGMVLAGATHILSSTGLAIIEASFFDFYREGMAIDKLVAWMAQAGFVPYDIAGLLYRPLDGALAQADVVFLPRQSPLRNHHEFANAAQRALQDIHLRSRASAAPGTVRYEPGEYSRAMESEAQHMSRPGLVGFRARCSVAWRILVRKYPGSRRTAP